MNIAACARTRSFLQCEVPKQLKEINADMGDGATKRSGWMAKTINAVLRGLGETTEARRCSSAHLVLDGFVIKCTMMDPRYRNFQWRSKLPHAVPKDMTAHCEQELRKEAISIGTAAGTCTGTYNRINCAMRNAARAEALLAAQEPADSEDGVVVDDSSSQPSQLVAMMNEFIDSDDDDDTVRSSSTSADVVEPSLPGPSGAAACHFNEASFGLQFDAEWQRYKALAPPKADRCPLDWWASAKPDEGQSFPALLGVARRYMTPLATSAPVEGTFSRARLWCRDQRSCIGEETFDKVVTLDTALTGMTEEELLALLDVGERHAYRQQVADRDATIDGCIPLDDDDDDEGEAPVAGTSTAAAGAGADDEDVELE